MNRLKQYRLVYLATPYTKFKYGLDEAHKLACRLAAKFLRAEVCTYSPIAHCHPISMFGGIEPKDHHFWLAAQRPMMDRCDAMAIGLLEGWNESFGIDYEVKVFRAAWKPIYSIHPETLLVTPWGKDG